MDARRFEVHFRLFLCRDPGTFVSGGTVTNSVLKGVGGPPKYIS